jgi:lincosamide nucleotidyltransferase A/C/D/E
MDPRQAVRILAILRDAGVQSWVDGGWGVDALLEEQTREHSDLDLVVNRRHLTKTTAILRRQGFVVLRNWLPNAIAFRDPSGVEVDLYPIDVTDHGGGDQILLDGETRFHYSPPVLGRIGGLPVLCCPVSDQLLCHVGYEPTDHDYADVGLLADRFGIALPEPYDARKCQYRVVVRLEDGRSSTRYQADHVIGNTSQATTVTTLLLPRRCAPGCEDDRGRRINPVTPQQH